jgi:hypothetical protein
MNTDSALVVTNNTKQTIESEKAYSVVENSHWSNSISFVFEEYHGCTLCSLSLPIKNSNIQKYTVMKSLSW